MRGYKDIKKGRSYYTRKVTSIVRLTDDGSGYEVSSPDKQKDRIYYVDSSTGSWGNCSAGSFVKWVWKRKTGRSS